MIISMAAMLAIGAMEGILLFYAKTTGPKVILNHFSVYHVFLGLLLVIIAEISGAWIYLPLMIILQDTTSKLVPEWRWFEPESWINWPFKRMFCYIPIPYIILIAIFIILKVYS